MALQGPISRSSDNKGSGGRGYAGGTSGARLGRRAPRDEPDSRAAARLAETVPDRRRHQSTEVAIIVAVLQLELVGLGPAEATADRLAEFGEDVAGPGAIARRHEVEAPHIPRGVHL